MKKNHSPRERQILKLLLEGKSNSEIGEIIGKRSRSKPFSHKTIEKDLGKLMAEYDVENRIQLAVLLTRLECTCLS
ncbi:MAG: helix-turn-helix transcriptional regulator [Bacteroidota bacterium]